MKRFKKKLVGCRGLYVLGLGFSWVWLVEMHKEIQKSLLDAEGYMFYTCVSHGTTQEDGRIALP